jgi:MoaA/NifB/PqqE/SkfB family radical SAM enzyme
MSHLVSISISSQRTGIDNYLSAQRVVKLPVLVISPHNQCDCRCVMCDIWKIRDAKEITTADFERQLSSLRKLGVQWVVFSGGEPQKNSQLFQLAGALRGEGIRVTLLTAGLLLESQAEAVAANIDDIIVSLDGPPVLHNTVRRVPRAFERMLSGIIAVRRIKPDIPIRARCTVQKLNHHSICATVDTAKEHQLTSISFLAVDANSKAYHHPNGWSTDSQKRIVLDASSIDKLEAEVEKLIREYEGDLESKFVVETPAKLRRVVLHFRAALGQLPPLSPRCNAPWVSAVIDAEGEVRPCFFHPSLGNIHRQSLDEIVNGPTALQFREHLDIPTNPVCQRCVCSLYIPQPDAQKREFYDMPNQTSEERDHVL